MLGHVHSIESMGLVDGPGIRTVVFMQGCHLRCQFCHNPDTWALTGGETFEPEMLVKKIRRFKPYWKNKGGMTFSGGEPLLQAEFLLETLKLLKAEGIHTCLDTAGVGYGSYEEILKYTDLVIYDIKHYEEDGYKAMTGKEIDETRRFLDTAQLLDKKLWIRQVVVPGKTDSRRYLEGLKKYVESLKHVEKVELLPYHILGVEKYHTMDIPYPLTGVEPMDKKIVEQLQNELFGGN